LSDRRKNRARLHRLWQRLWQDKFALLSIVYLVFVLVASVFAGQLAPYDPLDQDLANRLLAPGTAGHLLGTDALGRDVLSRMMHGARLSLFIGFTGVVVAMALGVTLGTVAGYLRGITDTLVSRIVDVQMAFSSLLLIMLLVVMIGPGVLTLILVFGFATWVVHARVARAATLSLREIEFVEASRAIGTTNASIMISHILPNLASTIISIGVLEMAHLMVAEATLSFLGFGVQPPSITWGLMIAEGRDYIVHAWWLVTFPGLAIAFTVIAVSMLGVWLRAISDPFQRQLMGR